LSRFVLDASVTLAWCFPDENSVFAERIAAAFRSGDSAIVPAFWPHEVLNALLAGEKRKRITRDLIRIFLEDLSMLPITLEQFPANIVFSRIQQLSRDYSLTSYDAAYLDLALAGGLPLATLDDDLRRAGKKAGARLLET
jgi:predicted nucleic acid-binding protein